MTTARELLVGLHELGAGRRLKVALGPAERALLPDVFAARLPMHTGSAWRRFVYPGFDSGPWAWGDSDFPVWLVDIGVSPGPAPAEPRPVIDRSLDIRWLRPRTIPSEERTTHTHATQDSALTLCGREIGSTWRPHSLSWSSFCRTCYRRAYGKIPPQWPANRTVQDEAGRAFGAALESLTDEPLWIPCIDEIELMNERRGDPRLLDQPPDGWPGRRRDLHGAELSELRALHRSDGAWERGVEQANRRRDQADARSADWAWHNRFFGKRPHVDEPRRHPVAGSGTLPG